MTMAWSQEDAWFVLCLAMILVYTVLAAYCVYVFLLQICRSPPKDRVWQKSFSVFLTCGCACRPMHFFFFFFFFCWVVIRACSCAQKGWPFLWCATGTTGSEEM